MQVSCGIFMSLQLLLSRLRLLHCILPHLSPVPSLAVVLSTLKASMAVGLPGQGKLSSVASIQPPLAIPQATPNARPMHSVAGPQERRGQAKTRNRNRTKAKHKGDSGSQTVSGSQTASDESGRQSSDSESSSASASEGSLSRWAGLESGGYSCKGKNWSRGRKGVSSSEGEVSDSDAGSAKFKTLLSTIRYQTLSCLTMLFQVSVHQSTN